VSRRVAHGSNARRRGEQCVDKLVQRRAIALDWRIERHVAPRAENGGAVIAETPVHQHNVARPRQLRSEIYSAGDHTDPRGRHEKLVACALLHDLRVSGDDLHARIGGCSRHGSGDLSKSVDGDAFLDDHCAGKIQRLRAADREIVDRSAHGKFANVAARKEQRIDDERIGRESQLIAMHGERGEIEPGLILEHGWRGSVESRDEHVVDQILHCLAAAAMRERHLRHEHPAERTGSLGGRGKSHVAASCFFNPPY
jgi:hypothetical protein